MKFRRKPRENVEINLASLIDVVFILLLFFVVTTTFTRETQLKVDLPEAATGVPPEQTELKQLEVLIDAQGIEVALEFMHDPSRGFLDALFHDLATMLGVCQAGGQNLPQRRIGAQLFEFLVIELFILDPAPHLTEQIGWSDPTGPQGPQTFGNDAGRCDRTQNDWQHHPAACFDQFPHGGRSPLKSGVTLA